MKVAVGSTNGVKVKAVAAVIHHEKPLLSICMQGGRKCICMKWPWTPSFCFRPVGR
jgi:hypothetical protein